LPKEKGKRTNQKTEKLCGLSIYQKKRFNYNINLAGGRAFRYSCCAKLLFRQYVAGGFLRQPLQHSRHTRLPQQAATPIAARAFVVKVNSRGSINEIILKLLLLFRSTAKTKIPPKLSSFPTLARELKSRTAGGQLIISILNLLNSNLWFLFLGKI
jgi:hypothetical protein